MEGLSPHPPEDKPNVILFFPLDLSGFVCVDLEHDWAFYLPQGYSSHCRSGKAQHPPHALTTSV